MRIETFCAHLLHLQCFISSQTDQCLIKSVTGFKISRCIVWTNISRSSPSSSFSWSTIPHHHYHYHHHLNQHHPHHFHDKLFIIILNIIIISMINTNNVWGQLDFPLWGCRASMKQNASCLLSIFLIVIVILSYLHSVISSYRHIYPGPKNFVFIIVSPTLNYKRRHRPCNYRRVIGN